MSSNRVETKKAQISAAIKSLKDSTNLQEKCKALSYIQSFTSNTETPQDLPTESQWKDICKLVINAFASGNKILYSEASCTLAALLRSYKERRLNVFNELMQINLENRLKIFQLLDELEDDTILAVSRDPSIIESLKDCLSSVNPSKMEWLGPNACADNTNLLQTAEYKTLNHAEQIEERIIVSILEFIRRIYKLSKSPSYAECIKFSTLFMDKIAILAYMGHKRQRAPAIKILQLPNMGNHIRSHSTAIWQLYKTTLQNVYCQRMGVLVLACEPDWSILWTTSVQLLGTDLHRGAGLINNLLSVEEKAFKSVDTIVRRQAFLSWKLIVDNFSLDEQELATARRVKLLCIPLNAKNSKTESMTLTKLEVWWHLVYKLYNYIEKFSNPVLTQFLNFCFGPLGDTPLLSSKFNVIASPGKRFPKTKLVAVDALLQLITDNEEDLKVAKSSLSERIPKSVSGEVFKHCYKSFIHSVGEACLSLAQPTTQESDNRAQVIAILWRTLLTRIKDTKYENAKVQMYKEVMHLVLELGDHSDDKSILGECMIEIILPSLDQFPKHYIFQFETIVGLVVLLTKPAILGKIMKKHHDLIKNLLWRGIKRPEPAKVAYMPNSLEVLKKLVAQLDTVKAEDASMGASVLWNVLCEIVTKYMVDGNKMNEASGSAVHNFTTVTTLIKFPFTDRFSLEFWQSTRSAIVWRTLYKQFDDQANTFTTVKPNEYVFFTISVIQNGIKLEKRCAGFAVTCLDGILITMNYHHMLQANKFSPILELLNDLCLINLVDKKRKASEAALRELSSVLITLYGTAPDVVATCLELVRPAIEEMLKPYEGEGLVREISTTWETMIMIFKGLGAILTPEILGSFKTAIGLALCHTETDIVAQTLAFLKTKEFMNGPNKNTVQKLLKEFNTKKVSEESTTTTESQGNGPQSKKPIKLVGSFLNRNINASPKPVTSAQKAKDDKKSPFFPDPESQEYVVIESAFKFDANRLTEHQKESLLRRREDIPALYNDLSQSCSQDTQNIQEWFDKKKNEIDKTFASKSNVGTALIAPTPNRDTHSVEIGDADKENKLKSKEIFGTTKENEMTEVSGDEKVKKVTLSGNLLTDTIFSPSIDDNDQSETDKLVAQKLDFESRTEFPENDSSAKKSTEEPSTSKIVQAAEERTKKTAKTDKGESETVQEPRRGVKRKAVAVSDSDSEGNVASSRRRRKTNLGSTVSETQSDSDSVKSTESEEATKQLSKRTQNEMTRLQINMVFDSKQFFTLPSRRRSKIQTEDENEASGNDHESTEISKSTRTRGPKTTPQEVSRVRVKAVEKDPKIIVGVKTGKKRGRKPKNAVQVDQTVESTQMQDSSSQVITLSSEDTTQSDLKVDKTKLQENPEAEEAKKVDEEKIEIITEEKNLAKSISEMATTSQNLDSEEIVESSQASSVGSVNLDKKYNNKQCFIRINKMKNLQSGQTTEIEAAKDTKKLTKGGKSDSALKVSETTVTEREEEDQLMAEKPEKDDEASALPSEPEEPESSITPSHNLEVEIEEAPVIIAELGTSSSESKTLPTEALSPPVRPATSILNSSSPKNSLKRYSKLKSVTTQGRAAHMLGLVTKQAIAETRSNVFSEEDNSPSKKKFKEMEDENSMGKKERILLLKEPERLGSPSGSRQEKIFNKMRISGDNEAPLITSNLFGNLRNDGEKSSPGNYAEKERFMTDNVSTMEKTDKMKDKTDDDNTSLIQERESLPMLEWSSANPPSLTASPSASILKRQRQIQIENDPESPTTCKRKRVSFADPPVSKEMGYEITASTPAHRMSKISASRIFLPRKDTPVRLKQTRIKMVQSSPGKSDKEVEIEIDKSVSSDTVTQTIQNDTESNILEDCNDPVFISSETLNLSENEDKTETSPRGNDSAKVTIDNFTTEIEIATRSLSQKLGDKDKDVELADSTKKQKTDETETQQDIFEIVPADDDRISSKIISKRSQKSAGKGSPPENSLRCVDINTLTGTTCTEDNHSARSQSIDETLEDTVDIQNVTGLNSTSNSDELFCGKPMRTSTQSTEADTLTITDSVFSNLPFSQNSQANNDTMELDQPELLDSTRSIFPSLIDSSAPIDSVIGYLADPLWKTHLSTYFNSKGIETVGNLARLTEREVNWIPVKRSPKIPFVKNVLQHFEKSVLTLPSIASTVDMEQESVTTTPNASMSSLPPTSTPIAQSSSLCSTQEVSRTPYPINESLTRTEIQNKSTETQISVEELIDEIDASVVLKSAIKRCSAENILANYKLKMKNMAEVDLERETIKMLGIELKNHADAHLKSACRGSGLTKVLGRLPDIFSHDKQFFEKVLATYRHKIQVSDCMESLDFEEVKNAVCKQCTSSALAEMLSQKLKEEEESGVTTPMTELSSLQAMLKRMPKDLVISHTVANEELISPLIVLDIALQNNTPSDISFAIDAQPANIRNQVFGEIFTVEALSNKINESNFSEDKLTEMLKVISKKLDAPKLLDVFNTIIKDKFLERDQQRRKKT